MVSSPAVAYNISVDISPLSVNKVFVFFYSLPLAKYGCCMPSLKFAKKISKQLDRRW